MLSTLICGGHLKVEFVTDADAPERTEDGALALNLTPGRLWWDGEEVSEVVAEATAIAWLDVNDEDDDEDDEG